MDYTRFENYPIRILNISEANNEELNFIEDQLISDIAYSGEVDDLELILPYFVYCAFIEERMSETTECAGEMAGVSDSSVHALLKYNRAWNIGAKMMAALIANGQTCTEKYYSQISLY